MKKLLIFFSFSIAFGGTVNVQKGNIVYVENGKSKQLTESGRDKNPILSPKQDWIYFIRQGQVNQEQVKKSGDEIWRVKIDGSSLAKLHKEIELENNNGGAIDEIHISPDGLRIYFQASKFATGSSLEVMNSDGTNLQYLGPAEVMKIILEGKYAGYILASQGRVEKDKGRFWQFYLFTPNLEHEIAVLGEDPSAFIELNNIKFTDKSEKEFVSIFRSKD